MGTSARAQAPHVLNRRRHPRRRVSLSWKLHLLHSNMSVPVSTTVEVFGKPAEYAMGQMNSMDSDGKRKVAFITGTTGQDGSYLVELLLSKGYIVHGIKRRSSSYNHPRLEHIMEPGYPNGQNFFLHYGDLTDLHALVGIIRDVRPTEVYNLAAQSHVQVSFQMPMYTAEVDGVGTLNLLEAIRLSGQAKTAKFYQASTSELYGKVQAIPQDEDTPFYPRSPYAVAKMMAYWAVVNYRESYDMYACNGILFNHESPRRGETFVTRKITLAVANIKAGKQECLYLGNMDAKRDWGHARDYVECMWKMLQQDTPEDFVVATGETNTVRHFVNEAFQGCGHGAEVRGPRRSPSSSGTPRPPPWSSSSRRWSRRTLRASRTPPCASKAPANFDVAKVRSDDSFWWCEGFVRGDVEFGRALKPTIETRRR